MHINKDLEGLIMSTKSIKDFYNAAMEQEKFSPEFWYELRKISTEKGLKSFIEEKVQPVAKEMGYNFSTEELLSYEEKVAKEITERQLEAVSGGVNVKNLALGGIISLMALGAGIIGTTSFTSAAGPESGSSITIRNNSIQAAKSWYGNWLYLTTDSDSLDGLHLDYSDFLKFSKTAGFKNASEVQAIQARNANGDMLKIKLDQSLKKLYEDSKSVPGKFWGTWGIANIKKANDIKGNKSIKNMNFEIEKVSGNSNEVKLLIANEDLEDLTVPSKMYDNGKEFKVISIGVKSGIKLTNLKNLNFDGDFDELTVSGLSKSEKLEGVTFTGNVKKLTISNSAFIGCKKLKNFTIQKTTNLKILGSAFAGCISLENFKMSNNIQELEIGDYAFSDCRNLKTFEMADNIKNLKIYPYAFKNCENLESFKIPDNVKNLEFGVYAFMNCKGLVTFITPANITTLTIAEGMFESCQMLKNITFSNNIKTLKIYDYAFSKCEQLKTLAIPNSVENLTFNKAALDTSSIQELYLNKDLRNKVYEEIETMSDRVKNKQVTIITMKKARRGKSDPAISGKVDRGHLFLHTNQAVNQITLNKTMLEYYAKEAGFEDVSKVIEVSAMNGNNKLIEVKLADDLKKEFSESKVKSGWIEAIRKL